VKDRFLNLDRECRHVLPQPRQRSRDKVRGCDRRHADNQRAKLRLPLKPYLLQSAPHLRLKDFCMPHERPAGVGQLRAIAAALKHPGFQACLQLRDAVRQGRLRHPQFRRRAAECAAAADRQKVHELPVVRFHS
jgi:hypothetical protein